MCTISNYLEEEKKKGQLSYYDENFIASSSEEIVVSRRGSTTHTFNLTELWNLSQNSGMHHHSKTTSRPEGMKELR